MVAPETMCSISVLQAVAGDAVEGLTQYHCVEGGRRAKVKGQPSSGCPLALFQRVEPLLSLDLQASLLKNHTEEANGVAQTARFEEGQASFGFALGAGGSLDEVAQHDGREISERYCWSTASSGRTPASDNTTHAAVRASCVST